MSIDPVKIPTTGGLDRSKSYVNETEGFYTMNGFRHARNNFGTLELTPRFGLGNQLSQGTYYDGGSTTESTTSAVTGILPLSSSTQLVTTDSVAWYYNGVSYSQLQVLEQSVSTAGTGARRHCLITVQSLTSLALNLGGSLDIVIDGATTFKWRKNGGAYTTLVPITTSGVSIDAGSVKVWFLVATGFNVGDSWSWTRNDRIDTAPGGTYSYVASSGRPVKFATALSDVLFLSPSGRMFRFTNDGSSRFVITVGYRPVWTRDFVLFARHLVIDGGPDLTTSVTGVIGSISWSDLDNYDNFYATDVNEADTYTPPNDSSRETNALRNLAFFVSQSRLFVIRTDRIIYTFYLGLPTVFNFETLNVRDNNRGYTFGESYGARALTVDDRVYLLDFNGISVFDGNTVQPIGAGVAHLISSSATNAITHAIRIARYGETVFLGSNASQLIVYQEQYNRWYTQDVSFSVGVPRCLGTDWYASTLYLGLPSRNVYSELTTTPLKDLSSGGSFSVPTLVFPIVKDFGLASVKELSHLYLAAAITDRFRGAAYAAQNEITVRLAHADSVDGSVPTSYTSADNDLAYNSSSGDIQARAAFRGLSVKLTVLSSDSSKPPIYVYVYELIAYIYGLQKKQVIR